MVMERHALAAITLTGMLCDVLGGLYLAYDLLGGSKGPLGTITRWVTYSLLFALVYGAVLGPAFGFVAGPALGLALALEVGHLPSTRPAHFLARVVPFGVFRGLALGISAALVYGLRFGVVFGVFSAVGLLAAYLVGSSPTQVHLEDPRPGVTWPRLRATAVRALGVGLAAWAAGQVEGLGGTVLGFSVEIAVVVGVVGAVLAAVVPLVEAWANRLPARRLGAFGVLLLLLGVLLQALQYWLVLLDVPVS
jgi:hypothetical protein